MKNIGYPVDRLTAQWIAPSQSLPESWRTNVAQGIVLINLIDADERLQHALDNLDKLGAEINSSHVTVMRRHRDHGSFLRGCANSHTAALALAVRMGWDRVLVLEDDFVGVDKESWSSESLGSRICKMDALDPEWTRLMLGYIPVALWPSYAGLKGTTLCTTAYIASSRYMNLMIEKPFDRGVGGKGLRSLFGDGIDHFQARRLAASTHVVWPTPVQVDPDMGQKSTHDGGFWNMGVGAHVQNVLQHVFWVVWIVVIIVLLLLLRFYPRIVKWMLAASVIIWMLIHVPGPQIKLAPTRPKIAKVYLDTLNGSDFAHGRSSREALATKERALELFEAGMFGHAESYKLVDLNTPNTD